MRTFGIPSLRKKEVDLQFAPIGRANLRPDIPLVEIDAFTGRYKMLARIKKEDIPLGQSDLIRHFRPKECLLFLNSTSPMPTGVEQMKTSHSVHWLKLTSNFVQVNFNQWNVLFCSNPFGSVEVKISFERVIRLGETFSNQCRISVFQSSVYDVCYSFTLL